MTRVLLPSSTPVAFRGGRVRPRSTPRPLRFRLAVLAASVVLLSLGVAPVAMAGGYGIFVEYGRGITGSGGDFGVLPSNVLSLFDTNEVGVGLAIDSNLAKDDLINSRVDLGFHTALFANDTAQVALGNGYGGMVSWALGFGVVRNERMRLWLAPNLGLDFDWFSGAATGLLGVGSVADLQFGVGPMIGLNLHTGERTTIALVTEYQYKWGWYFIDAGGLGIGNASYRDNYIGVNLAFFWRGGDDRFE